MRSRILWSHPEPINKAPFSTGKSSEIGVIGIHRDSKRGRFSKPGSPKFRPYQTPVQIDPAIQRTLTGCGKTTARPKMLSRFRVVVTKGRVLVASAGVCSPFPDQSTQFGVGLRRLHRQISQAD